jgi:hypothetical protein
VLGKRQDIHDLASHTVTPRDILELIEADPAAVFPSRWATAEAADGMVLHVLCHDDEFAERTHERGIALGLPLSRVVTHTELATMPATRPVRADLRELMFADTVAPRSER